MATSTDDAHEKGIDDAIAEAFWKALAIAALPALRTDRDAPWRVRLWRWRYVYPPLVVVSLPLYGPSLLEAQSEPFAIPFALFAHLTAPLVAWLTPEWVDPVAGSTRAVAAATTVLALGVFGVEAVRRGNDGLGPLPGKRYYREDDELLAPLKEHTASTTEDDPMPRLERGVSTAVLGETGSGKTEAMRLLSAQMSIDEDTAVIVHEQGSRLAHHFEQQGYETVRISLYEESSDAVWNMFEDLENESDYRQVADALVAEDPDESNPFHGQAKQVVEVILRYLVMRAESEDEWNKLGHHQIDEFLNQDPERMYRILDGKPELQAKAQHLHPETRSGMEVYKTLTEDVADLFSQAFAQEGDFSIRDYIDNPDGRVLVLQTPTNADATTGPMYQTMITWAIKHAMASETPARFLLDEIDMLPEIDALVQLTSKGRSEGARAVIGLQTVAQLRSQYGQNRADAVLGNCPQGIYYSPGEHQTVEYVTGELGQERHTRTNRSVNYSGPHNDRTSTTRSERTVDEPPITSGELKRFATGEAVVVNRTDWWRGELKTLDQCEDRL